MSKRYPGGLLSTTGVRKPSVSDQSQNSGIWTLDEQYQADANGTWANQGGSGYEIANSLRHSRARNTYLRRVHGVAGNPRTVTYSVWMKRGYINNNSNTADGGRVFLMLSTNTAGSNASSFTLAIEPGDRLAVQNQGSTITTTNRYRDPSAWYHIVAVCDTTKLVPSDRTQLYVNGVRVTTFDAAAYPSQNAANIQAAADQVMLGDHYGGGRNFDGHLAEIHYVDGQALEPSSFGYFDYNGIWQPKRYTGSYGNTGFYLPFNPQAYGDSISTTAIGLDKSGNGNNFTSFNFSTTAGINYDLMKDSPTNGSLAQDTGAGGQTNANYPTFNPLNRNNVTVLDGNMRIYPGASTTGWGSSLATIPIPTSGKWYFEGTLVDLSAGTGSFLAGIGIAPASNNLSLGSTFYLGETSASYGVLGGLFSNLTKYNGASAGIGGTVANGGILMCAYDADTGRLWFGYNGSWLEGSPSAGTTPSYTVSTAIQWAFGASAFFSSGFVGSVAANFGQRPFAYAAPTGFRSINTASTPMPSVPDGKKHFDIVTWIGSGDSVRDIVGLQFKPDLVYSKARNATNWPFVSDSVRGLPNKLYTNDTGTEDTNPIYGLFRRFNSDGFTTGPGTGDPGGTVSDVNASGVNYVAWNWRANDTQVTNTSGTISTQVRANNVAGFSIIGYTGNGTEGATIGHGLNRTPKFVIIRHRSGAGNRSWPVWSHLTTQSSGSVFTGSTINIGSKSGNVLSLNLNSAFTTYGMDGQTNAGGATYIAYCWAEIEGYSKIGTYTGNGSSDGSFIYTGFSPRFILVKQTNAVEDWAIYDTARNRENPMDLEIWPNQIATEYDGNGFVDFLSNGFKWRSARGNVNTSGNSYIYMAFAENPFNIARAR
jgi:hypothetical protein